MHAQSVLVGCWAIAHLLYIFCVILSPIELSTNWGLNAGLSRLINHLILQHRPMSSLDWSKQVQGIANTGKAVYDIYSEGIKQRGSGERVFPTNCNCHTNCYMHGNEWCDGGNRYGICGTRKDHSRIYLCPAHAPKWSMMKSMNLMFQTSWVLLLGFRVQLRPSLVRFSFVINSLLSLQMNSLVSLLETIIITLGELFVRFI